MDHSELPVGSILCFSVDDLDPFYYSSWRLCLGDQMNKTRYPDLFNAIGYSNGSSASDPDIFYLPNLQGSFLRGVDETGAVDKDAKSRVTVSGQPAPFLPGSVQGFATAMPTTGLQVAIGALPTDYSIVDSGEGPVAYKMMGWNSGIVPFTVFCPDAETVPVNTYMQFIIKVAPGNILPIGSIIPYAGTGVASPDPSHGLWSVCEGAKEVIDSKAFKSLYGVTGARYGITADQSRFYLPDLQGSFIRGVDVNGNKDKNGNRTQPPGLLGVKGAVAGSTQLFGTGTGVNPIVVNLPHYPLDTSGPVFMGEGQYNVRGDDIINEQTWKGGDSETRPVNVYVQFLISLAERDPSGARMAPVGSIIAIPGAGKPDTKFWRRCDGSVVMRKDLPELFAAFNDTKGPIWGSTKDDNFSVPDMRGYFLRGVDNTDPAQPGRDPDRAHRTSFAGGTTGTGSVQGFATSTSRMSINAPVPTRHWQNMLGISFNITQYNRSPHDCYVTGGDSETRPINLAVEFYVKCFSGS
jgi:microcystin-dependent protein